MKRVAKRPIPLHKPQLEQMTERALEAIKESLVWNKANNNNPLSKTLSKRWYRTIGTYYTTLVTGKRAEVPVEFRLGSKSTWGLLSGGNINKQKDRIVINLNPSASGDRILSDLDRFAREFHRILSHEVTHLRDIIGKVHPLGSDPYYNSPHEIRAYMRNLVDEVLWWSEGYAKDMNWFEADQYTLKLALEKSKVWGHINKKLDKKSRRRMLQAVYRAMKDIEPELKQKYPYEEIDIGDDWKPPSRFQSWVEDTSESLGFKVAAGVRPYDILAKSSDLPYGNDDDGFRALAGKKSTLVWGGGLRDRTVPLSDLLSLTHGNVLRQSTEDLKASILREGFKGGAGQRLFIEVTPRGEAILSEGNHRLTALKELLREGSISKTFKVPIEIRYRGNSDLNSSSWFPRSMMRSKTAARPIQLPTRDIKRLAKDLTRKLRVRGLPKPSRVVAEEWLTLSNVKGDPVDVEIILVGSPALDFDNKDLIRGGYFKRNNPVKGLPTWASPLPGKVVIYLNSYLPPTSFEKRPDRIVEKELYTILSHELTHAADIWSGKGSVGDLSKSTKELKQYHHNHPTEVRALMREVVNDVEPTVQEYLEMGISFNDAVRYALKDSKWVDIEPYLNSKSKKTILKGVHTYLQDQGLNKAAAYDPGSWHYDNESGLRLQTIIDRWQKHKPRQKMYESDQPVWIPIRKLWPLREYTWTRDKARSGYAQVKGNSVWLDGPLKWDAIKEDMKMQGWDRSEPLYLNIGHSGVKVGEGNHRLAIAKELGIREIPVRFLYQTGTVRKTKIPAKEPIVEIPLKAIEKAVEKKPQKPLTPEEESSINDLMDLIMGRVASRYLERRQITAVRKRFWHGTSSKALRGILKQGLIPTLEEKQYGGRESGAYISIETFGGIYLTDNYMNALSHAGNASRNTNTNPLIVGMTLETRSPKAIADEDNILPVIARSVSTNSGHDLTEEPRSFWNQAFRYRNLSPWGATLDYHKAEDVIETIDLTEPIQIFFKHLIAKYPRLERRYKRQTESLNNLLGQALRAHARYLLSLHHKEYGKAKIKDYERYLGEAKEHLKQAIDENRDDIDYWKEAIQKNINTIQQLQNPPVTEASTFQDLNKTVTDLSFAIRETIDPAKGWQYQQNMRFMEPITYRGRNRIQIVAEHIRRQSELIKRYNNYTDIVFRYAQSTSFIDEYMKEYQQHEGGNYRIIYKGRVLETHLAYKDSIWPVDLWGDA